MLSPRTVFTFQADVVLANILAKPLIELSEQISALVLPADSWFYPASCMNRPNP
jgi:ribosomal protein L11 methylase PrmA